MNLNDNDLDQKTTELSEEEARDEAKERSEDDSISSEFQNITSDLLDSKLEDLREELEKQIDETKSRSDIEEEIEDLKSRIETKEETLRTKITNLESRLDKKTSRQTVSQMDDKIVDLQDEKVSKEDFKAWKDAINENYKTIEEVKEELKITKELNRSKAERLKKIEEMLFSDNGISVSLKEGLRENEVDVEELEEKIEGSGSSGSEVEIEDDEIEEPEKNVPDLDVHEIAEKRRQRREILTSKQDKLYIYALRNPEASKAELQKASGMNWANTVNSLRTILDKNFQLPLKLCRRHGLETEFSGETTVVKEDSKGNAGNADKDETLEA